MPRYHQCVDGTLVPFTPEEEAARDAEEAAELAAILADERRHAVTAVQQLLDNHARSWGYDDMRSAVSYLGDPHPRFAQEALALRDWRSSVWVYVEQAAASAQTIEEFFSGLPQPPQRPVAS